MSKLYAGYGESSKGESRLGTGLCRESPCPELTGGGAFCLIEERAWGVAGIPRQNADLDLSCDAPRASLDAALTRMSIEYPARSSLHRLRDSECVTVSGTTTTSALQFKKMRRGSFVNTEEINPHLTAKIVESYVRHHKLGSDQLADLITSVHRAIGQVGQPPEPEQVLTPAVSVRRSVHRDHVICLDCGYRGKTLRRHISTRHGLSPNEYRQRWGLRSNHLLTAPAYSEHRSSMAKELGLGRKPVAKVAPPPTPAASAPADRAGNPKARRTRRPRPASKSNVASEVAAPTPAARRRSRARAARSPFSG
jgi:predicted transcriptional regulator